MLVFNEPIDFVRGHFVVAVAGSYVGAVNAANLSYIAGFGGRGSFRHVRDNDGLALELED